MISWAWVAPTEPVRDCDDCDKHSRLTAWERVESSGPLAMREFSDYLRAYHDRGHNG